MDEQKLLNAIEKSPLAPEDKQYWQQLLGQMTLEQKQRFYHTIVVKTDVKRASDEISSALDIINKALEEEQAEQKSEQKPKQPPPSVVKEMVEQTNVKEHVPDNQIHDPQAIKQKHEETEQKLEELRGQLADISKEVNSQTPPSYQ